MIIEILHTRDSDGPCYHTVFLDGVPVEHVDVEDVDPGRGYTRGEWDAHTAWVQQRGYSDAFTTAVVAARTEADDTYLDEE